MNKLITEKETDAPIELVGGKGKGLLKLKSLEEKIHDELFVSVYADVIVPSFFIISPEIKLSECSNEIIRAAKQIGTKYVVRSSSPLEDTGENSFDGIFETKLNISKNNLLKAVKKVRESATSQKAKKYANSVGVELEDNMPVIVQKMVAEKDSLGVVYSKFPCPRDIVKIVRDITHNDDYRERYINAFTRWVRADGTHCVGEPVVISKDFDRFDDEIECIGSVALVVEDEVKYPIIMEFASHFQSSDKEKFTIYPLQARKLTKLLEAEKFEMPELQDKGLIATTYDLNGVGDFRGEAYFVSYDYDSCTIDTSGLKNFDKKHPNGYVLVTPYLQFWKDVPLDSLTPNKKVVIAYTGLGEHHDMEISRKNHILYLNAEKSLSQRFYVVLRIKRERLPIETGETVRVVSNGEIGFIFNLSRE